MLNIQDAEQYADDSDRASHVEDEANTAAIEAIRLRAAPEMHPDFDGSVCVECGDILPAERLAMGRVRCTICQTARELKSKHFRRH